MPHDSGQMQMFSHTVMLIGTTRKVPIITATRHSFPKYVSNVRSLAHYHWIFRVRQ
jgi:hypothetical protein